MESDMVAVSQGRKRKDEVLESCLQRMKACFLDVSHYVLIWTLCFFILFFFREDPFSNIYFYYQCLLLYCFVVCLYGFTRLRNTTFHTVRIRIHKMLVLSECGTCMNLRWSMQPHLCMSITRIIWSEYLIYHLCLSNCVKLIHMYFGMPSFTLSTNYSVFVIFLNSV